MKKFFTILALFCAVSMSANYHVAALDTTGWAWEGTLEGAAYEVHTPDMPLHFFGWSPDQDTVFVVNFPEGIDYSRATLMYRMTAGGTKGFGEWDMTTHIMIEDKELNTWREFTRAITPYGRGSNFYTVDGVKVCKDFYWDISEYLTLLHGDVRFRICYWGWDATPEYAHAVHLGFALYDDKCKYGAETFRQKIYDSTDPSTAYAQNGYRAWSYGIDTCSIEQDACLGKRKVTIPAGTDYCILRVCFSGHGQDAVAKENGVACGRGTYPDRPGYRTNNSAEFDYNRYQVVINGDTLAQYWVWEDNSKNYKQYGTYKYNRCGWGPGKPCNVQHLLLTGIPAEGCELDLDLDLDRFISTCPRPRTEYVPCFYVATDIYGYQGEVPVVPVPEGLEQTSKPQNTTKYLQDGQLRMRTEAAVYDIQGRKIE